MRKGGWRRNRGSKRNKYLGVIDSTGKWDKGNRY
jgi:hypothetical protein